MQEGAPHVPPAGPGGLQGGEEGKELLGGEGQGRAVPGREVGRNPRGKGGEELLSTSLCLGGYYYPAWFCLQAHPRLMGMTVPCMNPPRKKKNT